MEFVLNLGTDADAIHALRAYAARFKRKDPDRHRALMKQAREADEAIAESENDRIVVECVTKLGVTKDQVRTIQAELAVGKKWRKKEKQISFGEDGMKIARYLNGIALDGSED